MSNLGLGGQFAVLPDDKTVITGGETATEKTVIANRYRARQMDSFRFANTIPRDWVMCEIKGVTEAGEVQYEVPAFPTVTPFSTMYPEERMGLQCELCGHPIKYPVPIRANVQQLVMWIGSDCVNNFYGAGYVTKKIKIFMQTKLRNDFQIWLASAIRFCDSQRITRKPEPIPINFRAVEGNAKAVQCDLCKTRILNTEDMRALHTKICKTANPIIPTWMLNRVPEVFYRFGQKLRKMDTARLSSRKILNALTASQELNPKIPLSAELQQAYNLELKLKAIRLAKQARKSSPQESGEVDEDLLVNAFDEDIAAGRI